jgi:RHS repeat-associated protein
MRYFLLLVVFVLQMNNVAGNNVPIPPKSCVQKILTSENSDNNVCILIFRGFTGHQHLDQFALINMNGRMYDPVVMQFLSPDPYVQMPENPLNYNRYAYALFSPLQYVDLTGEMFDWYQNRNGDLIWQPSKASTLTINGDLYNNIGESVSLLQTDGTYLNYFQNIPFRSEYAFDAKQYILENKNLRGELMSTKSKLWEPAKTDLMKARIYQGQNKFIRGTAEFAADASNGLGLALSGAGTAAMAIPGLQAAGGGLVAAGGALSTFGSIIDVGLNIADGNYKQAALNATSAVLGKGTTILWQNLKLTPNQTNFLTGKSNTMNSTGTMIINWGLNNQ